MNRRNVLQMTAGAALAGLVSKRELPAQEKVERATRAMPSPRIKDIQVIATQPGDAHLVVVKVITEQDGLYGYGCASFNRGAVLVVDAVEKYLKPFLVGKPADRIDDTWQACYNVTYWRNGPVLNNAISGVDQALWDIKGRQAGLPVYQLLGGKCREAAACYAYAEGAEIAETIDLARGIMARGFRHVRVQVGVAGMAAYGRGAGSKALCDKGSCGGNVGSANIRALHKDPVFEPGAYKRRTLKLLEECRKQLGDEVELLHDVHERLPPRDAVLFAKEVEPFRLFFLEDDLSPEDIDYFRQIRQQCSTPLAMGELFNNPHEWTPVINERLIDYIRIHLSQAGGLTPCRKIAAMAEIMGVRTAWHGPVDVSPVGHAANLALDLACYNFGIQEYSGFTEREQEIFHGCPVVKDGYLYANEAPGWGIEVDEKLAAKFPLVLEGHSRGVVRRLDGTVIKQ